MLAELYSHLFTMVFMISVMPSAYPEGFDFPKGCLPNTASYHNRGWCFCEASVASLAKDAAFVWDLGRVTLDEHIMNIEYVDRYGNTASDLICCRATKGRLAPMLPEDFECELQQKSFTSKKADCPRVAAIYHNAFKARFGEAEVLSYVFINWGDTEAEALARVFESGAAPNLFALTIQGNNIGTAGFNSLARAVRSGAIPLLRALDVTRNPGDSRQLIAAARAQNPNVEVMELGGPRCRCCLLM